MTQAMKHARITTASHSGDRATNEDTYRVAEAPDGRQMVVVCDGLAGETAGQTASRTAADAFVDGWVTQLPRIVDGRMEQALSIANASVRERIESDIRLDGMATTLVAIELDREGAEWISVGSSPLWHWRWNGRTIRQLNQRHNRERDGSTITSAVTGRLIPQQERGTILPAVGDLLIAATDGLDTLEESELLAAIDTGRSQRDESLAASIVRATLEKKARRQDNVTVVVLETIAPES